jgi:hypothetical protein
VDGIDLETISKSVSDKLNEPVVFVEIQKIGSGFHATGYKLIAKDGRAFFIKKVTTTTIGLEFPERRLSSLLVGHNMAVRSGQKPQPIGLFIETDGKTVAMPELREHTNFYHVQEFQEGGTNYMALLEQRVDKTAVDELDRLETTNMVDIIAAVHAVKYDSNDVKQKKAVYMAGLRGELIHPELILTFMHELDETHLILPPSKQGEFLSLYIKLIHDWKDREDRLCALHGDFWGANMLVQKDGTAWTIDFSRIPWGDPGIDIGRWMGQYVWMYLTTKNEYYKELGELFLSTYEKKTGDLEIRHALSLGYLFDAFIYPVHYDSADLTVRKKMFVHGCELLRHGEFFWPQL